MATRSRAKAKAKAPEAAPLGAPPPPAPPPPEEDWAGDQLSDAFFAYIAANAAAAAGGAATGAAEATPPGPSAAKEKAAPKRKEATRKHALDVIDPRTGCPVPLSHTAAVAAAWDQPPAPAAVPTAAASSFATASSSSATSSAAADSALPPRASKAVAIVAPGAQAPVHDPAAWAVAVATSAAAGGVVERAEPSVEEVQALLAAVQLQMDRLQRRSSELLEEKRLLEERAKAAEQSVEEQFMRHLQTLMGARQRAMQEIHDLLQGHSSALAGQHQTLQALVPLLQNSWQAAQAHAAVGAPGAAQLLRDLRGVLEHLGTVFRSPPPGRSTPNPDVDQIRQLTQMMILGPPAE